MIHLMQMAALIEEAGEAAIGTDLFLFTIPAEVQDGVMLRGPLTGDPIDEEQPGFFSSEFLVVVRGGDEESTFAKCQNISAALTMHARQSGDIYVTQCRPRTRPIPYPRNEGGTVEWGIPFVISWGESV